MLNSMRCNKDMNTARNGAVLLEETEELNADNDMWTSLRSKAVCSKLKLGPLLLHIALPLPLLTADPLNSLINAP